MEAVVECREAVGIPVDELDKLAEEFGAQSKLLEKKMHRLPANLRTRLSEEFIVPMAVAIGPYHHGLPHLQEMEKMKKVAAYHLIGGGSGQSPEWAYSHLCPVAEDARRLYDDAAVAGMRPNEFAAMMLHDACFLVQYMLTYSDEPDVLDPSLQRFFFSNRACIDNDIMLLENQLPWMMIELMMGLTRARLPVVEFIGAMGKTMQMGDDSVEPMSPSAEPPHLLGLLRLYKTSTQARGFLSETVGTKASVTVSATALEGIGIKLRPAQAAQNFSHMGVATGRFFDELFLPSLNLNRARASWLVNMAALEVCTHSIENDIDDDTGIICSYIAVLAMLMDREEDVHKLRSEGFLHGELSDRQILDLFKTLSQQMDPGSRYFRILAQIESCKIRRRLRIMVHRFASNNAKTIAAVLSAAGVVVGIFTALLPRKQH